MDTAYREVERLLEQIRAVSHNPVVERCSDQIQVLCASYMEPVSDAHKYGLTKSLAAMFDLMVKRMGHTVSIGALLNVAVRNGNGEPECPDNILRVQIWRLRKLLKPHGFVIENIPAAGYRLTRTS